MQFARVAPDEKWNTANMAGGNRDQQLLIDFRLECPAPQLLNHKVGDTLQVSDPKKDSCRLISPHSARIPPMLQPTTSYLQA